MMFLSYWWLRQLSALVGKLCNVTTMACLLLCPSRVGLPPSAANIFIERPYMWEGTCFYIYNMYRSMYVHSNIYQHPGKHICHLERHSGEVYLKAIHTRLVFVQTYAFIYIELSYDCYRRYQTMTIIIKPDTKVYCRPDRSWIFKSFPLFPTIWCLTHKWKAMYNIKLLKQMLAVYNEEEQHEYKTNATCFKYIYDADTNMKSWYRV